MRNTAVRSQLPKVPTRTHVLTHQAIVNQEPIAVPHITNRKQDLETTPDRQIPIRDRHRLTQIIAAHHPLEVRTTTTVAPTQVQAVAAAVVTALQAAVRLQVTAHTAVEALLQVAALLVVAVHLQVEAALQEAEDVDKL